MIKYALAIAWVVGIRMFLAIYCMATNKWALGIIALIMAAFEVVMIFKIIMADDSIYQKHKRENSCCLSITREE